MCQTLSDKLGVWLVAARRADHAGRLWDVHVPIHQASATEAIACWLALSPQTPILLDAVYGGSDDEYLDAVTLDTILRKP